MQIIFRHKQMGGQRVGTPAGVQPGDTITYCTTSAGFQTRVVAEVSSKTLKTEPLKYQNHVLAKAETVDFDDIREILRPDRRFPEVSGNLRKKAGKEPAKKKTAQKKKGARKKKRRGG